MTMASPRIVTERTIIRMGKSADVPAILNFFIENEEFLRPWSPVRKPGFYTEEYWYGAIHSNIEHFENDRALRMFVFDRPEGMRIIGEVNFSNFTRGAAQFCTLGYSVSQDKQGQGYMREAVSASIDYL